MRSMVEDAIAGGLGRSRMTFSCRAPTTAGGRASRHEVEFDAPNLVPLGLRVPLYAE
jgi:hypothetical protein